MGYPKSLKLKAVANLPDLANRFRVNHLLLLFYYLFPLEVG